MGAQIFTIYCQTLDFSVNKVGTCVDHLKQNIKEQNMEWNLTEMWKNISKDKTLNEI